MLTIREDELYKYINCGGEDLTDDQMRVLEQASRDNHIRGIMAGSNMSEDHIGGDDFVSLADSVINAIAEGYKVHTWYGPDSEVIIIGYKPEHITITKAP